MKKPTFLLLVLFFLLSCVSQKKATGLPGAPAKASTAEGPRFLENISIPSGKKTISSTEQNTVYTTGSVKAGQKISNDNLAIESRNALQFKYAILLNLPVETDLNERMLEFIEQWYGTPYQYGGTSKKGIDCSAFVAFFMSSVYGLSVPRNSKEQYVAAKKINKRQLREGDLIFFNTSGGISHVGVYMRNNKFVHASTSNGVIISDLDEDYFSRRYVGSGRVLK